MTIERSSTFLTAAQIEPKVAIILGCGSVGATVAQVLCRMGVGKFMLVDNGIVEEVNIGPQPYDNYNIGEAKTEALMSRLGEISPRQKPEFGPRVEVVDYCSTIDSKFMEVIPVDPAKAFVLLALDSMEARKAALAWLMTQESDAYGRIVDVRMGLQELWLEV